MTKGTPFSLFVAESLKLSKFAKDLDDGRYAYSWYERVAGVGNAESLERRIVASCGLPIVSTHIESRRFWRYPMLRFRRWSVRIAVLASLALASGAGWKWGSS